MDILIVTQKWYPDTFGGSEYVASEQARGLAKRGHKITVLTEKGEKGERGEKGITIYRYGSPRLFARVAGASRAAIKEAPKTLKGLSGSWDVVVLHHPFPAYGFFKTGLKIPTLYIFHASTAKEIEYEKPSWIGRAFAWWADRVERSALKKSDRVAVFSDFSQNILKQTYPFTVSKIIRLSIGIDLERFKPGDKKQNKGRTILTVRRLVSRMGLLQLIRAMVIVIKVMPDARLVIVGDGPMRGILEREIDQRGLREYVTLAGIVAVDDLPRHYQAADLFALPTQDYEGLGIATLEALASGLPVVGTPAGATPEILGALDPTLVTRSPSTKDIANGILGFFKRSQAERLTLSKKAREIAEQNYNWDIAIDQLESICTTLSVERENTQCCA